MAIDGNFRTNFLNIYIHLTLTSNSLNFSNLELGQNLGLMINMQFHMHVVYGDAQTKRFLCWPLYIYICFWTS
jgi:hypothetical protein